jgi:ectoine hydroxylase-related dioxygenase (phytanoyl-CoA dioxygenase family)
MQPQPPLTYATREFHKNETQLDIHIEEFLLTGCTIVENVWNNEQLDLFRNNLDAIYNQQCAEIGGENNLSIIKDTNIARCLLSYNDLFLEMATQPFILQLLTRLLGDYYILSLQNGIINLPNQPNYQTFWHRDLQYQHFLSSRPLAVNALTCVDNFNAETGGTYILPHSNKAEKFPSDDFVVKNQQVCNANAGSVLVFDAMLYHRAGYNASSQLRRGVNTMYSLPFIKQQINLQTATQKKYADNSFLSQFLGYDSDSDNNVQAWREKRILRNTQKLT